MTFLVIIDIKARHYFVCCRSGTFLGNPKQRITSKKRLHQKESRKINGTCISRMYVDEYKSCHINVQYISAHTGHELGPNELKYLQLPKSTKEEVSMKISAGIPPERILQGIE